MKGYSVFAPTLWFAAMCLLLARPGFAQLTAADILGTVTAPAAVIVNANITAEGLGTHQEPVAQTNAEREA